MRKGRGKGERTRLFRADLREHPLAGRTRYSAARGGRQGDADDGIDAAQVGEAGARSGRGCLHRRVARSRGRIGIFARKPIPLRCVAAVMQADDDGKILVAAARAAAMRHGRTWETLVPDRWRLNANAEAAEEAAYAEMAAAEARLRDHICATYGLSIRELSSLAIA